MGGVICEVGSAVMGEECEEETMAMALKGALHIWAQFDDEEHDTIEEIHALC